VRTLRSSSTFFRAFLLCMVPRSESHRNQSDNDDERATKRLLYCSFVYYALSSHTSLRKYRRKLGYKSRPHRQSTGNTHPEYYHGYLRLFKRSHNLSHLTSIRGICRFLADRRCAHRGRTHRLREPRQSYHDVHHRMICRVEVSQRASLYDNTFASEYYTYVLH
jgi:hypothetical protein